MNPNENIKIYSPIVRSAYDSVSDLDWATDAITEKIASRIDAVMKKKGISKKELAVSFLQPALDQAIQDAKADSESIDYIHGEKEVFRLGKKEGAMGILLPPVDKDSFFATISSNGPLPRKSFSMGEADEKRFYLECRRLFS